ncbi:HMG-Y-related protein A [Hirschfeldia incana]|nr:HMG-Y-related protein A [Hirschfeldia incana]
MATETELEPQQSPMAEQQPSSFDLPPYPQMIMEAIEASNDANGCNKTAIARHIESTQTSLPPSHMTLLSYHLNQMKQSGQIAMVKNNYMKPDPQAPPKRGRGRPPKAKAQGDSSHVAAPPAPSVTSPRPRGRPPKAKDPSSEVETKVAAAAPSGSGRPRGRPPKKQKTESEAVKPAEEAPAGTGEPRRGRGRPPKVKPAMVPVGC